MLAVRYRKGREMGKGLEIVHPGEVSRSDQTGEAIGVSTAFTGPHAEFTVERLEQLQGRPGQVDMSGRARFGERHSIEIRYWFIHRSPSCKNVQR